jgi:hypothetical protein
MKIMMRSLVGLIVAAAVATGFGLAQVTVPEKRAIDIMREQSMQVKAASPACQQTRNSPTPVVHNLNFDPSTLEPTLESLMEKSDEVILASATGSTGAIAPSGEDVVMYFDVKVLRTWKGSHKVGDTVTFSVPSASILCLLPTDHHRDANDKRTFSTIIDGGSSGWPNGNGPHILFLRHSHDEELQLTPGLRLTGGDGIQGVFSIQFPIKSAEFNACSDLRNASAERCNPILEVSEVPVQDGYYSYHDPLFKKYNKMPMSDFLKEVQSAADSLGTAPTAVSVK